jgi:hypothetical protein
MYHVQNVKVVTTDYINKRLTSAGVCSLPEAQHFHVHHDSWFISDLTFWDGRHGGIESKAKLHIILWRTGSTAFFCDDFHGVVSYQSQLSCLY